MFGITHFQVWVVLVSGSNVNDLGRTKGVEEPALVFQVLTNFRPQTLENSCQAFNKTHFKNFKITKNTDNICYAQKKKTTKLGNIALVLPIMLDEQFYIRRALREAIHTKKMQTFSVTALYPPPPSYGQLVGRYIDLFFNSFTRLVRK